MGFNGSQVIKLLYNLGQIKRISKITARGFHQSKVIKVLYNKAKLKGFLESLLEKSIMIATILLGCNLPN